MSLRTHRCRSSACPFLFRPTLSEYLMRRWSSRRVRPREEMHTRSGICYPRPNPQPPRRRFAGEVFSGSRKRARLAYRSFDFFDGLPDDIALLILSKLSASAGVPCHLISVHLTCRRLNRLGTHPMVLSNVSAKGTAVRAMNWSESAHRFLNRCVESGSLEACYTLGMIRFYCLENRGSGASLMAKAAMGSHAAALYSLAVIQFNGSGGSKNDKDLRAGVALCARAAHHGQVDALRELGHCLQDGYGVRQNVAEGRRFLVQANAWELAAVVSSVVNGGPVKPKAAAAVAAWMMKFYKGNGKGKGGLYGCSLLSDFGCNVPSPEAHPANRFMVEWFAERGGPSSGSVEGTEGADGLRMCSHGGCGRPETRRHEFRRCSVCGTVNYCSRACQALHWKLAHKTECAPLDRWLDAAAAAAAVGAGGYAPAALEDGGGEGGLMEG
ncbi:F-box protein [Apostasia shenzhenica]|uniref:F-box protein n=1 Tax=Apostasia shenzhenica TaxID=1088818 RepID=A0A2I0AQJ1_9ASPA|nr:F-box protein [Apostasia shenzhenica]